MTRMKRTDSLRDLSTIASHFPGYLTQRVATESFVTEALQYAAWLPLAAAARYLGWNRIAYLFLTWFILGSLLNVYVRQNWVTLRWWQVLLPVVVTYVKFGTDLSYEKYEYWRFLVLYVIGGISCLAVALPLMPKKFLKGAPSFLFNFFGFLKEPKPNSETTKTE